MNKRLVLGIAAGAAAFAAVAASAATLGGLTSTSLGAETTVVAACDTDGVTLDYTTALSGTDYKVTAISLGGVNAACANKAVKISLSDGTTSLGEVTGTKNASTSQTFTLATPVSAKSVTAAAVVIAG
jgi:hypothetical protein